MHDVMPETLNVVERVLAELAALQVEPVTLLVVPGRDWSAADIERLHALVQRGYRLAAHGWLHHCDRLGGLYHRLHARLLSRRVAEHLALDTEGILELLHRSRHWFVAQGFAAPTLYVPPAWAMGAITRTHLRAAAPFAQYEVFGGIYVAKTGQFISTPMLGYEADSAARVPPLRLWNAFNRWRAQRAKVLRIGIHPYDFDYALAQDLRADLSRFRRFREYAAVEDDKSAS